MKNTLNLTKRVECFFVVKKKLQDNKSYLKKNVDETFF